MIDSKTKLKGVFILTDGAPVPFLYNPDELTEVRSVSYEKKNVIGMSHPRVHYKHGNG